MKILAIETSCDETGVAILECEGDTTDLEISVRGNALLSQVMQHREYGGVYPNLAKRLHAENLVPLLKESLKEANFLQAKSPAKSEARQERQKLKVKSNDIKKILEREPSLYEQLVGFLENYEKPEIDAIAVTQGPGLEPALWVGINFARTLSLVWGVPLVGVDHMEGHITSVLYQNKTSVEFPALALLISGGHTELVLVNEWGSYEIVGQTRDDAVGEAFDKVARILGLPYPGGPEISRLAEQARNKSEILISKSETNSNIKIQNKIQLPRPMIDSDDLDFSFSGLKTAVLYLVKELGEIDEDTKALIAREFEDAVCEVLVDKTARAIKQYRPQSLIVAGGVIANKTLRDAFAKLAQETGVALHIPTSALTTDNAIMIGIAGYLKALHNNYTSRDTIVANGNLKLAE